MATTAPSTVYLQIELSETPFAILGVSDQATEPEIREKYLALALIIHPDKASNDKLRELHTSLFQKVQSAYNEILKTHSGQQDDEVVAVPKRLPETLASLHARNVTFQEALRNEREKVLNAKRIFDTQKATKQATLQAKHERLASSKQSEREEMLSKQRKASAQKAAKQTGLKAKNDMLAKRRQPQAQLPALFDTKQDEPQDTQELLTQAQKQLTLADNTGDDSLVGVEAESPSDWEEHENLLEAAAERETIATMEAALPKPKGALQDKPTAGSARTPWDPAIDERLVSDAEIKGRWSKNLLSGGRAGSVSLRQKKQREHNGSARIQKTNMGLCEIAENMVKPALTGNRTFSGLNEEELVFAASVETEKKSEARTDRMLELMDGEIKEQYLLDDNAEKKPQAGLLEFPDGRHLG